MYHACQIVRISITRADYRGLFYYCDSIAIASRNSESPGKQSQTVIDGYRAGRWFITINAESVNGTALIVDVRSINK